MVKHNNVVPNQHFHKDWARRVRTWFDQPGKKERRRNRRLERAKRLAPRPLNKLRPVVRGQTLKYNSKVRAGRGFTYDEIEAAKVNRHQAQGLGITIGHRRKNRSDESFKTNVARLKIYLSKLVVFPRHPTSKKSKKGDASKEETKQVQQVDVAEVLPIINPSSRVKARKITKDEKDATVVKRLRKERLDAKLWGLREKRAKDKELAAKDPNKAGKKGKKGGDDLDDFDMADE